MRPVGQGNRVNEIDRASPLSVIPRIKSVGRLSGEDPRMTCINAIASLCSFTR